MSTPVLNAFRHLVDQLDDASATAIRAADVHVNRLYQYEDHIARMVVRFNGNDENVKPVVVTIESDTLSPGLTEAVMHLMVETLPRMMDVLDSFEGYAEEVDNLVAERIDTERELKELLEEAEREKENRDDRIVNLEGDLQEAQDDASKTYDDFHDVRTAFESLYVDAARLSRGWPWVTLDSVIRAITDAGDEVVDDTTMIDLEHLRDILKDLAAETGALESTFDQHCV